MSDLQRILDWITGQIPFLKNKIKSVEGNFDNYAKKSDIPSLDGKADKSAIPTKVSQLENDSGYLSAVPDVYAKKSDIPDISGKQDKITDLDTIRTNATAGAGKQDKLIAGDGIAIDGTTIKAVKIEYIADSTTLKITTPTGGG